jgi:hypothetical protein
VVTLLGDRFLQTTELKFTLGADVYENVDSFTGVVEYVSFTEVRIQLLSSLPSSADFQFCNNEAWGCFDSSSDGDLSLWTLEGCCITTQKHDFCRTLLTPQHTHTQKNTQQQ